MYVKVRFKNGEEFWVDEEMVEALKSGVDKVYPQKITKSEFLLLPPKVEEEEDKES